MALTEIQTKSLKAKLKRRHVKTRESSGASISYVEGWHAIAEANRIFGFDSWDRKLEFNSSQMQADALMFATTKAPMCGVRTRTGGDEANAVGWNAPTLRTGKCCRYRLRRWDRGS